MIKEYIGVIVEESLEDNRMINRLDVKKIYITNHKNPMDRWHMYEVSVNKGEILSLSKHIVGNWYMHFWKGTDIIAVFKDCTFEFNYDNKNTWENVLDYGRTIGIPEHELDFPIKGLK